jgi:hypothetical protein
VVEVAMKLEPVIVVHGTFAQDSDWFRRDSIFCKTLNSQLKQRGSTAECWSHLASGHEEFRWSGANSELERRLAGWYLLDALVRLELRSDVAGYHIISHSHGGNVVISALGHGYLKKLRTVTFLGCPFAETKSRTGYLLFRSSVIFLLVTLVSLVLVHPENQVSFDFFTWLSLGVFFWFSLSFFITLSVRLFRYGLQQNLRKSNYRCFTMQSKHDEAYAALVASIEVMRNRGRYARMLIKRYEIFPNMDYWYFRLLALPPIPVRGTHRLTRSLLKGFRIFDRIVNTATAAITGVTLLPFTLAVYGVRYLGVRIGLGAVAAMATGDDFGRERITSFARRPPYLMAKDLEIPPILDDELKDQAARSSSEVLHGIYELLSAPVATNVAEIVRKALTDPYLVHSQYYKHEQLICQMASAISGNENFPGRGESSSSWR